MCHIYLQYAACIFNEVTLDTDQLANYSDQVSSIWPIWSCKFLFSISGVFLSLSGSGQVSVLNQTLGGASHSHKLEFTVRSAEELNDVMEELKACDSRTTLQHSVSRLCTCFYALITRFKGFLDELAHCLMTILASRLV